MGISGEAGNMNLSEESKKALQSETWQAVREKMKEKREVKHFTAELTTGTDNAYGWIWDQVVKEYLRNGYNVVDDNPDIVVMGEIYKTLRRPEVTVFYDAAGGTLFDVTNERLEKEYEWLMNSGAGAVPEDEESEEDNQDAEKDTAVDQEEADTEAGEAPAEERTAEPEKETPDDEAERSGSVEAVPEGIGWNAADNKEKSAKYSGIDGAVTKLQEELKGATPKEFAEPVIEYLVERCKESESLAADICQTHKTWKKCYDYIVANAKKKLNNVSGPVRSDTVFEWAEDYYHKDDKAEEEKKVPKAVEDKAKREKVVAEKKSSKNTGVGKAKKVSAPKKIGTPKEPPKPKRSGKDIEGQMDMFSVFGM